MPHINIEKPKKEKKEKKKEEPKQEQIADEHKVEEEKEKEEVLKKEIKEKPREVAGKPRKEPKIKNKPMIIGRTGKK